MTSHLAPESPRPLSVTAENYFRQLHFLSELPVINNNGTKCLFGEQYEKELCFYLAKHAEMNCDDRVCLISEQLAWTSNIQERLFLNKPICLIDCNLYQGRTIQYNRVIALIRICYSRNLDAIKEQLSSNKFDRIILLNCLHKIPNTSLSFINLLRRSMTINGKLIIIHREPSLNTLPFPIEVSTKWLKRYANSSRFITQVHSECETNIEIIKFNINKLYWFSLLYNQAFFPLTLINQQQIADGLRQLNETYFKYHQGLVEIHDRLLFLIIQNET